MRHWLTRVGCDEYDRALAATPDVCRPFAAAIGDRRPASLCLAQYAVDRALTLSRFAATADGAQRLALLARAIAIRLAAARSQQCT